MLCDSAIVSYSCLRDIYGSTRAIIVRARSTNDLSVGFVQQAWRCYGNDVNSKFASVIIGFRLSRN